MAAGDTHVDRVDLAARHQFGFLHRTLDGLHSRLNIDHHAFFHALGRVRADADNLDSAVHTDLPDNRHHLGGTDIQPDDHFFVLYAAHGSVSPVPLVI